MSQNKCLHIISLTIPYPPNYGGVIDIWYKIRALHEAGMKIILHCYEYNRQRDDILENYCSRVYYYPRKKQFISLLSLTPFIVQTRKSVALTKNLLKDQHPILIEGIHSLWLADNRLIKDRNIWLRTHNVESEYFRSLYQAETSWWKKIYFYSEVLKLRRYEKRKLPVSGLFSISPADQSFFSKLGNRSILITPFHGHQKVTSKIGQGTFLLYHADLSVSENRQNAIFIASLSPYLPQPLIIAGRSPDLALKQELSRYENVQLQENLPEQKMSALIENASIIMLPAMQKTGFRLKLLSSLYTGRHIVASPQMVENTGLESLCRIAASRDQWISLIKSLSEVPFSAEEKDNRNEKLKAFSDYSNAQKIISEMF